MIAECARESEILEAVAFGRWPGQCGDLAAHAASCAICADLIEVARALHDDREALCREAQPPGSTSCLLLVSTDADEAGEPVRSGAGVVAFAVERLREIQPLAWGDPDHGTPRSGARSGPPVDPLAVAAVVEPAHLLLACPIPSAARRRQVAQARLDARGPRRAAGLRGGALPVAGPARRRTGCE